MQCPSCKQEVPQSRFCGNCGAPLALAAPAAPSLPTAFGEGGRYRVERKLGEGGKGIVFLCQDTVLGRRVAVKLIKGEGMDSESLARFQREVHAMASLVHPNVVTIFDIGQESPSPLTGEGRGGGGRYYLVLELMEGGDVEGLIKKAPNGKLDAATAVRITSEAARGLAHAHGHGILHRDIKPGNIWMTREGFAKLGDFGLAYLDQSGARLTRAGMMVGTVAYMAPELALGRGADARSDLYMLGASLYEMLTGRLPFPSDDPVRVIFSHINDLPPDPKRFAPDLPDALVRVIMRLLAKDPEGRPASANEVIQALAGIGGMPSEARRGEVSSPASPGVRAGTGAETAPLQRTPTTTLSPSPSPAYARPLVGRDRERDALRARLDAAMQGQGGLVFLTGEAGIGKTRLAAELRAYARQRGCLWLEGRYEKDAGIPGQPYQEAIRQYLRTASRGAIAQHVGQYAAELSRSYPDIGAALGATPLPVDTTAIQEDPQGARQRQLDAFCHLFTSFAHEKPMVLFLDDLQWSPSMDYLQALAQRAQTEPLLLIGAYREQELKESQPLSRTVLAMNRLRLFQAMPLHRLEAAQVREMVRHALGQEPSEQLASLLYDRTQGNPFFVEELVRHLVETGALTQGEHGWDVRETPGLQMPDSVKVLVEEKLERLSEGTRTMLAMASVIGGEFDLALLQEVTGLDDDALLTAVEEALDARILTPKSSVGREAYTFGDNQIREALYEGISSIRRRRFHLRVGQAIEKVHARRLEEHYGALANHFIQGNDTEKAADYSIKAGDAAYARATFPRAMEHYRVAAELLDELGEESERAAHVHAQLGSNLMIGYARGSTSDAAQQDAVHLERAIHLFTQLGKRQRAASLSRTLAGNFLTGTGVARDWDEAGKRYQLAADLLEQEPDSPEKSIAYGGLALWHSQNLQLDKAEQFAREALRIAQNVRSPDAETQALVQLGETLRNGGHVSEGMVLQERAWEVAHRAKSAWFRDQAASYPLLFSATFSYGRKYCEQWYAIWRESQQAVASLRYAPSVASEMAYSRAQFGEPDQAKNLIERWNPSAFLVMGGQGYTMLLALLGNAKEALSHASEVDAHQRKIRPHNHRHILGLYSLGWIHLHSGNYDEVVSMAQQARDACFKGKAFGIELLFLPLLTIAYTRLGQLDEAHKALARAQEILASGEEWLGLPAAVYHAEGVLAAAQGRYDQAESAFRRAADTSLAHGMVYDQGQALYDWAVMCLDRAVGQTDIRTYGQTGTTAPALTVPPSATPLSAADALALGNRGQDLLDQALGIFRRCDAKKDIEKCLARKERLTA
ncbi:MAG: DUF2791 family P-loop domain-containing protein [Chloroflexi bacterium]|nr:DUF2791 family P-loop domain-containing protein [Chloroflexota bacterium]